MVFQSIEGSEFQRVQILHTPLREIKLLREKINVLIQIICYAFPSNLVVIEKQSEILILILSVHKIIFYCPMLNNSKQAVYD